MIAKFKNLYTKHTNKAYSLRFFSIATLLMAFGIVLSALWSGVRVGSARTTDVDCGMQTQIPEAECEALVSLYNVTQGPEWGKEDWINNWIVIDTPCSWSGVTCVDGHVTQLVLYGVGMYGVFWHADLSSLTNLEDLILYDNHLLGPITGTVESLTNLQDLRLANNLLSGSIPSELSNLTNLEFLSLSGNQLTGGIPSALGTLHNLQVLSLSDNQLTGSIPVELSDLSNLYLLWLHSNQLSGEIPWQLSNLFSLEFLYLYDNQLTGSIPGALASPSGLNQLLLHSNQLSGEIPSELGDVFCLNQLSLHSNQLSGEIPSELGNLTNCLSELLLHSNQLSGDVPPELAQLVNLDILDIGYNGLSAADQSVTDFLTSRDPDWAETQTVAPVVNQASATSTDAVQVGWTPISYTADGGYYQAYYSSTPGGPYTQATSATADKSTNSYTVSGLSPDTTYYFVVETHTPAHAQNQNAIDSALSNEVSATTNAEMPVTDCAAQTDIPQSECESLLELYNTTDGPNWSDSPGNGWNVTNTPCSWTGVTCADGHVTQVSRDEIGLNDAASGVEDVLSTLGDLPALEYLDLSSNQLTGNVPVSLTQLTSLSSLDIGYNGLQAENQSVADFLTARDPDWMETQTVPPVVNRVSVISTDTVQVSWHPISYTADGGHYQVYYSLTPGGPYTQTVSTTADKSADEYTVSGLAPNATYYFVVQTYTPPHAQNQNAITSTLSNEINATIGGSVIYLPLLSKE